MLTIFEPEVLAIGIIGMTVLGITRFEITRFGVVHYQFLVERAIKRASGVGALR